MIKLKEPKRNRARSLVQIIFFILIALIGMKYTFRGLGIDLPLISSVSLHAICPFGGVVSIYQYLNTGTFVKKIHESSFILMGLVFLLSVGFGAVFCGWICPLGTLQEWIGKIGKKIWGTRYNHLIPDKTDNIMRYARYVVLAGVLYATAITGVLVFSDSCPYHALFNFWSTDVATGGLIVLVVTVLLSLLVERPWCKYACPYGAVLGIFNAFRIFKLRRNESTCISCKLCDKNCPMNIKISGSDVVRNHQCIACFECSSANACPVPSTIGFTFRDQPRSYLRSWIAAVIVLAVIFGGVGLSKTLSLWMTTAGKQPVLIAKGEHQGKYNPADIRGSYTLGETGKYFDVPIEHLAEAFCVPVEIADNLRNSDLESKVFPELAAKGTEIGNGSVKLFTALYTGLPYQANEPTYLLKQAVDILKEYGKMDNEQLKYIEAHMIVLSQTELPVLLGNEDISDVGVDTIDMTITGNTTFGDMLDLGLCEAEIEDVFDSKMPPTNVSIKNYCNQNNLNFGEIKEEIYQKLKNAR